MLVLKLHKKPLKTTEEGENCERFCESDGLLYFINIIRSNHYPCSAMRESTVLCWHHIRCSSLFRQALGLLDRRTTVLFSSTMNLKSCLPSPRWLVLAHDPQPDIILCTTEMKTKHATGPQRGSTMVRKWTWEGNLLNHATNNILDIFNTACYWYGIVSVMYK